MRLWPGRREEVAGAALEALLHRNGHRSESRSSARPVILESASPNPPRPMVLQRRGDLHVIALVQQPQVRCTVWTINGQRRLFYVATPYVAYVIGMSIRSLAGVFAYYSNSFPTGIGDILCHTNLPNIWPDDRACLGDSAAMAALNTELARLGVPRERAIRVIGHFWSAALTWHLPEHFFETGRLDERFATVASWASLSRRQPEAVLATRWRPSCSLGAAMEKGWLTLRKSVQGGER